MIQSQLAAEKRSIDDAVCELQQNAAEEEEEEEEETVNGFRSHAMASHSGGSFYCLHCCTQHL